MVSATRIGQCLVAMARISLKASPEEVRFGHPCSGLIESMMSEGATVFAEKMLSRTGACEFRLNGAGLKLFWGQHQHGFHMSVAGDQESFYPVTVPRLKEILQKWGFDTA